MSRILIVDDEVQVANALRRLFRRTGFEVETASSGREALDKLAAFNPDVVLSDFRMPAMNGAELLAEVKRRMPLTLRLILSGYADLDSVLASVNEGEICRFFSKPWDDATLVPTITELLRQREVLATLHHAFDGRGRGVATDMVHRDGRIELQMGPTQEPFSVAKAIELIRKVAGLLENEDLGMVSGLLERHGGKLSLTAEIGGQQRLSLQLPVAEVSHADPPPVRS
jgi:two-component system response regulator VicR